MRWLISTVVFILTFIATYVTLNKVKSSKEPQQIKPSDYSEEDYKNIKEETNS